jgi:hypothetical protein
VKTIALNEAQSRLDEIFEDAQADSPVLLGRGGEVAKLERVAPPEFGGNLAILEKMLARPGGFRKCDLTLATSYRRDS